MKTTFTKTLNTWIANPFLLLLIPVLIALVAGGTTQLLQNGITLPDANYSALLPQEKANSLFELTCRFVADINW